jgi:hypothetical protein
MERIRSLKDSKIKFQYTRLESSNLLNNGSSGEIKKATKLIGKIKQTLSQEAK